MPYLYSTATFLLLRYVLSVYVYTVCLPSFMCEFAFYPCNCILCCTVVHVGAMSCTSVYLCMGGMTIKSRLTCLDIACYKKKKTNKKKKYLWHVNRPPTNQRRHFGPSCRHESHADEDISIVIIKKILFLIYFQ